MCAVFLVASVPIGLLVLCESRLQFWVNCASVKCTHDVYSDPFHSFAFLFEKVMSNHNTVESQLVHSKLTSELTQIMKYMNPS